MAAMTEVIRKITAKTWANQRTKNRVKENGPFFAIIREDPNFRFQVEGQIPGVLLDSKGTGWFGWLPKEQIEIHSITDEDA